MIKIGILTASDKGFTRERIDESGPTIQKLVLKSLNCEISKYIIVPDEKSIISSELCNMADNLSIDLILTTGGTGFSQRDVTPEATSDVIHKFVPGISEFMRMKSFEITPKAMLSRGVCGIRNKTLIINLPGSPKSVSECLSVILSVIPHAIEILNGQSNECAR